MSSSDGKDGEMDIAEALRIYEQHLMASGRSVHTCRQYARHIGWLIQWGGMESVINVGDVSPAVLAAFLCADISCRRRDGELKLQSTQNCLRSSLRSFFAFLCAAGHIAMDPARLISRAHFEPAPPRGLTNTETRRLLEVLDKDASFEGRRDRALVRLLLAVGLRIGSTLNLKARDLCAETSSICITKGKRGRRDRFFVPADVFGDLQALVVEHRGDVVFATRRGAALSVRHVQRRFSSLVKAAGLRDGVSPHSLRHAFAMGLLRETGNLAVVKEALGHRSIGSTLVYARADQECVGASVADRWSAELRAVEAR